MLQRIRGRDGSSSGDSDDSDSEKSLGSSDVQYYKFGGPKSKSAIMEVPVEVRKTHKRIYYLDWLRIGAIYMVVTYHCVQALRWIGFWPDEAQYTNVLSFMATCLQFGMPTFFHISGRAQALSVPAGFLTTLKQRTVRLLLPFLVCWIVLIPPWRYIDTLASDPDCPSPLWRYEIWYWAPLVKWLFGGLWRLEPLQGFIGYDVAWLWFLPVLFVITVLSNPLFIFAERRSPFYGVVSAAIWVMLAVLLRLANFTWQFCFWAVIGPLFIQVVVIFVPLPSRNPDDDDEGEEGNWNIAKNFIAAWTVTFAQIFFSVMLVENFSYNALGLPDRTPIMVIPMLTLYLAFYVHGYFVQRWFTGSEKIWAKTGSLDNAIKKSDTNIKCANLRTYVMMFQALVLMLGVLLICASSPIGDMEMEMYPIYSASFLNEPSFAVHHVMGTWAYVGCSVAVAQAYMDEEIQPWLYRHASRSTVVVYIFHWVFIKIVAWWLILDFDLMDGIWKRFLSPLMLFVAALGGSFGIYALCLKCPLLGKVFGT